MAPVDSAVLRIDESASSGEVETNSRQMLIRKKRAFELARLLDAKRVLTANRLTLTNPDLFFDEIKRGDVRTAFNTAFYSIKSSRIGTSILELTTCGAVRPYNEILGGKLVSLLMLSPEVRADIKRRYGNEPTIIRSQLKNQPVVPDNNLVWLGTTSLYSHGSSQYERLVLPSGTTSENQQEIRYVHVGNTSGYGTLQFSTNTMRSIDVFLKEEGAFGDVNSVFGEGPSPKMRKLRRGLDALGFDSEFLLMHHQERRIYGVPLCSDAASYLCGLPCELPSLVKSPEQFPDASEKIVDFWRSRWLSMRLDHEPTWKKLKTGTAWTVSTTNMSRKTSNNETRVSATDAVKSKSTGDQDCNELDFWRELANAGPNVISEGLSDREVGKLHIQTDLEALIESKARSGTSVILTGNAGDGKTHLIRLIKDRLTDRLAEFVFVLDATAVMTREEGIGPVIDAWESAVRDRKTLIIAINQYPLYRLRIALRDRMPSLHKEVEQLWVRRLKANSVGVEGSTNKILLVDLALRNPLAPSLAKLVLNKMLDTAELKDYANAIVDSNFTFNYQRLSDPEVQARLFCLFNRLISAGERATFRELWILFARLLFGTADVDSLPGSEEGWYSERLFVIDERFNLTRSLAKYADPVAVSHPHIDKQLDSVDGTNASDWILDREIPDPMPIQVATRSKRYIRRFAAIKRRFYFEHRNGGEGELFGLDDSAHSMFHELLNTPGNDGVNLRSLIRMINRAYFPGEFEGIREKLCLWVGHRLDEQPTVSYIANEYYSVDDLEIARPSPPKELADAFGYKPDHLMLTCNSDNDTTLRVDSQLYGTLLAIERGLARFLVNQADLNRLDAFIDSLLREAPRQLFEFLVYNTEYVSSCVVRTPISAERYESIRRLGPS